MKYVILNETDAKAVLNYLFNKITVQRFKTAYEDTVKLDNGKHTKSVIYESVMNGILNCAISYVKTPELGKYVQNNFKKHYTV